MRVKMMVTEEVLNVVEMARILGTHTPTLYRLISEQRVPAPTYEIGCRRFYRPEDVAKVTAAFRKYQGRKVK